jgi:hypothetical protein
MPFSIYRCAEGIRVPEVVVTDIWPVARCPVGLAPAWMENGAAWLSVGSGLF